MILNKILSLLNNQQRKNFLFIIILGIIFSILELFSIAIFLPLINLIQSGSVEFMSESKIFKTIFFDYLSISDYKHVTISISIIIILIYLIKLTYHRFFNRFRLKFVNNFTENLINNFFTKFQTQSYINYKYSSSSSVIHKIFTESNQIRNILDSVILAFTESFTITLLLVTSLMYDYVITLIALLFFSTVYIVWQFFSKTDLNSLGRIRKSQEKQRFKIFQISYSSFREVLIYNQHKFFRKIFENHNYKATNTLYKYAFKRDNVKPLIEFITISSISFLIIALFFIEDYDSIMIRLAFFATIAYKLMPSINKFSGLFQTIKFNKVSLDFNLESFHIEKIKSNKKDKIKVINEINVNNISYKYQGIPSNGYTEIFEKMLKHKNIDLMLNTDYFDIKNNIPTKMPIIYSGPIDRLFNYKYGKLDWRTLKFEMERPQVEDFQGTSVMNYAEESVPFTRIHEPRHLHPEASYTDKQTLIIKEVSMFDNGDNPYYPVNDEKNQELVIKYRAKAEKLKNIHISGRLGDYKYYDMHQTIENALDIYYSKLKKAN